MKDGKINARFMNELKVLRRLSSPLYQLKAFTTTSITMDVHGAPESIYSGELFTLLLEINGRYPIDPPTAVFVGNIPVNEHVYANGHICISVLHDDWSPAMTLEMVVVSILSMLSDAKSKKKPPDNFLYSMLHGKKSPRYSRWMYH